MSLEPVTGFNIANNILKIFKLQIPLDLPVIRIISQALLVRELNMYFNRIRKEDESLSFEGINQFSEE